MYKVPARTSKARIHVEHRMVATTLIRALTRSPAFILPVGGTFTAEGKCHACLRLRWPKDALYEVDIHLQQWPSEATGGHWNNLVGPGIMKRDIIRAKPWSFERRGIAVSNAKLGWPPS